MSSRFVSGGVVKANGEIAPGELEKGVGGATSSDFKAAPKNAEWEAVQKELEAERKRREEKRVKAASGEEKSLYEVLQANKEAKQAAFEEQNKIRNQFRALDDDEIDFLDEVREKQRKEEAEKKKELEEGLKAFRDARKGEEVVKTEDDRATHAEESWDVGGRKRKRTKGREALVKGVRRKVEGDSAKEKEPEKTKEAHTSAGTVTADERKTTTPALPKESSEGGGSKALGLVGYGSDDSDDE